MTAAGIIITAFSIGGLFVAYHYLVVRKRPEGVYCYEIDYASLSDMLKMADDEISLIILQEQVKDFKAKYAGYVNPYTLSYDIDELNRHIVLQRIILEQEPLTLN